MKLVRGDKLTESARKEVLSTYGYRWTSDNPQRSIWWQKEIEKPRIPTCTDEEWLRNHAFWCINEGRLARNCKTASAGFWPA